MTPETEVIETTAEVLPPLEDVAYPNGPERDQEADSADPVFLPMSPLGQFAGEPIDPNLVQAVGQSLETPDAEPPHPVTIPAPAPEPVAAPKRWWSDFIAFDTETTGVGADARILDIAIVRFKDGEIVATYETLIHPGANFDWDGPGVAGALRVNQLAPEMFADAPPFSALFDEIMQAFASAPIWVAHNKLFDLRMMRQERARLEAKLATDLTSRVPKPKAIMDTMYLDICLDTRHVKRKLAAVCERWGVQPGTHRAKSDAIACGQILWKMVNGEDDFIRMPLKRLLEEQKKAASTWAKICQEAQRRAERLQT